MSQIKLEILEASYWEHFKSAKDLASYLPLVHPKRKKLETELNRINEEIHKLKEKINGE